MILRLRQFNSTIDLDHSISALLIEDRALFRGVCQSLVEGDKSVEGEVLLYEGGELLDPKKELVVLYDYYTLDFTKHFLTKFYKRLRELALQEYGDEFQTLQRQVVEFVHRCTQLMDFDLETEDSLDITELFKAVQLSLVKENLPLAEQLIQALSFIREVSGINHFVFLNLATQFEKAELIDLLHSFRYSDFRVLLVESADLNGEIKALMAGSTLLIDTDFCELY